MAKQETYDTTVRLRLSSAEKALWETQAKAMGMSLSDAMRAGTQQFLAGASSAPVDPLVSEFRALGARMEARFRNE